MGPLSFEDDHRNIPSSSKTKAPKNHYKISFETISADYATQLLKALVAEEKDARNDNHIQPEEPMRTNEVSGSQSNSKFAKLVGLGNTQELIRKSEIESYLAQPRESDSCDILCYWYTRSREFPILSSLAKKYLAIPATTGSVERLFSMTGSIARARRARTTPKTFENIMLYKESRENQLFK